jgi:hypothetical protein
MSLSGSKREINKFIKNIKVSEENYDINKLVPLDPSSTKETTVKDPDGTERTVTVFAKEDSHDGYLDAVETWGSKWGACDVEIDNPQSIRFTSAWSPCTPLFIAVSKMYPNVIFSIVSTEEAQLFAHYQVIHNGETVWEESIDPTRYPPEVQAIADKAEEEDTAEAWEEWYEAESDWRNHTEDKLYDDCMLVTKQYIKHVAKSKRRAKQGKELDAFFPE